MQEISTRCGKAAGGEKEEKPMTPPPLQPAPNANTAKATCTFGYYRRLCVYNRRTRREGEKEKGLFSSSLSPRYCNRPTQGTYKVRSIHPPQATAAHAFKSPKPTFRYALMSVVVLLPSSPFPLPPFHAPPLGPSLHKGERSTRIKKAFRYVSKFRRQHVYFVVLK